MDTVKNIAAALTRDTEDESSEDVLDKIAGIQKEHASKSPSAAEDAANDATLRADGEATNLESTAMEITMAAGAQGNTTAQETAKLPAATSPTGQGRPAGKGNKLKNPTLQNRQDKAKAQGASTESEDNLDQATHPRTPTQQ